MARAVARQGGPVTLRRIAKIRFDDCDSRDAARSCPGTITNRHMILTALALLRIAQEQHRIGSVSQQVCLVKEPLILQRFRSGAHYAQRDRPPSVIGAVLWLLQNRR